MTAALGVQIAAVFTWLGMVLAISFLEAPLKFRAPGITIPLGVGIGRLVFRALNIAEAVLWLAVLAGVLVSAADASPAQLALVVAVGVALGLGAQAVRAPAGAAPPSRVPMTARATYASSKL